MSCKPEKGHKSYGVYKKPGMKVPAFVPIRTKRDFANGKKR